MAHMSPGDLATWLTAIGTCLAAVATLGAVLVALYTARNADRRAERAERRAQAELLTGWISNVEVEGLRIQVELRNASAQCFYHVIASLISLTGAFRDTALGDSSTKYRTHVLVLPPGSKTVFLLSGGGGMSLRFGVELAFQDAAGRNWLRRGDGHLSEVQQEPIALYGIGRPYDF